MYDFTDEDDSSCHLIPLGRFPEHVHSLHLELDCGFEEQFYVWHKINTSYSIQCNCEKITIQHYRILHLYQRDHLKLQQEKKMYQRTDLKTSSHVWSYGIVACVYKDVIIYAIDDHCCVLLTPIDGEPGSNYINATWIDVSTKLCSM